MRRLATTILPLLLPALPLPLPVAAQSVDYLTRLEHEIVLEHNLVRAEPAAYARYLEEWLPYFEDELLKLPGEIALRTIEGRKAVEEAIDFLRAADAMGALSPSPGMSLGARDHVIDIGPDGATGHAGSDGSEPRDRVNRYGRWRTRLAENIAFGSYQADDARTVVMQLLIDDGVRARGHRANIFNADFAVVGVSCGPHVVYEAVCLIDYAGGYDEASDLVSALEFHLCASFVGEVETSRTSDGEVRHVVSVGLSEDGSRALGTFTGAHLDERARILVGEEVLVEAVIRQALSKKIQVSSPDSTASQQIAEQVRNAPPEPCGAVAAH